MFQPMPAGVGQSDFSFETLLKYVLIMETTVKLDPTREMDIGTGRTVIKRP